MDNMENTIDTTDTADKTNTINTNSTNDLDKLKLIFSDQKSMNDATESINKLFDDNVPNDTNNLMKNMMMLIGTKLKNIDSINNNTPNHDLTNHENNMINTIMSIAEEVANELKPIINNNINTIPPTSFSNLTNIKSDMSLLISQLESYPGHVKSDNEGDNEGDNENDNDNEGNNESEIYI